MPSPLPAYSHRHLDPNQARAYRTKFQKSLVRRLSARRERRLVGRAIDAALAWLEAERSTAAAAATLLDYPCGAGRFAPLAAGKVAHYVAGDLSPHMIAIAAEALGEAGLGAKLADTTEGDARAMDLTDDAVDLALCMRLLHHFEASTDRIQILSELRRVTRGPLVTSFLDAESAKQRRHVVRLKRHQKTSRRVLVSPAAFAEEARAAGWHVEATWGLSSLFSGQRIAFCTPASA
jgi:ubiquinone/menaquinone biosynthesis C-methylase UbiE